MAAIPKFSITGPALRSGNHLNTLVNAINNLTGNGTAGPVSATTVTATGNVSTTANVTGQSVLAGTGGKIGYTSGGTAVTQLTSRTTAVTANTGSGSITLFSAAGSATLFSFTVNNSLVLATDTIVLSQKSGTDKYRLDVTAVGAGTFEISVVDLTGTTTESPVINFAILKAVAA